MTYYDPWIMGFQETKENLDRTHGVCYACHEHCVPKNGIKLMDPNKFHFGGNFFCDCGSGHLDKPCTLGQNAHQHPSAGLGDKENI